MKSKFKILVGKVNKGEEELNKVLWFWGVIPIFFDIFIIEKVFYRVNLHFIEIIFSLFILSYFVWHLFVIRRTMPEYKLTKEEKKEIKVQKKEVKKRLKERPRSIRTKEFFNDISQKLLLKKPWGKFSLTKAVVCGDLIVIFTHLTNISLNFTYLLS